VWVTTTLTYFFGQPSGATPNSFGHLSSLSRNVSWSLSGSGQPSSSSKPSLSSASFGHLSSLSLIPSASLSRSGQPSSSSNLSKSSGSSGHLSTSSVRPSPSRSPGLGGSFGAWSVHFSGGDFSIASLAFFSAIAAVRFAS